MQVDYVDHMGTDLTTVNAARVSFGKAKDALDVADRKLISYLARHEHWSPFAHTSLSFRVTAPIFVARQLAKHQVGAAWNEESRRYIDDSPDSYRTFSWRKRAKNAKQGSDAAFIDLSSVDAYIGKPPVGWYRGDLEKRVWDCLQECGDVYDALISAGVAPEMARMVLPQATMTTWIWTGSLLFFARVCRLRQAADAQAETREIADQIAEHCRRLFPVSWAALMDGPHD